MIGWKIVDEQTGEIVDVATVDLTECSDEQLDVRITALEGVLAAIRSQLEAAKAEAARRLVDRGATLAVLPNGAKWRLHKDSRPNTQLARELFERMPAEWRDRCFKLEPKPMKRGLNEYAKLGAEQAQQVERLYDVVMKLVREEAEEQ